MDTFLKTSSLTRLNHEERENANRSVISEEIESVIKNLLGGIGPVADVEMQLSVKILMVRQSFLRSSLVTPPRTLKVKFTTRRTSCPTSSI